MAAIKVDGKTMNAIAQMYAQYTSLSQQGESEFEFRLGEYKDGRFVPGVPRPTWEGILKYLKQRSKYTKQETSVKIYSDGYREIRGRDGVVLQHKKTPVRPIDVDGVGRFSLATEKTVDVLPSTVRVVEVRDRFRYSFKFSTYTVDLTHIKNQNRFEVEIEYAPDVFDVKGLFAPIKDVTKDAQGMDDVVREYERLFRKKGVNFNNALNMKRKYFQDLSSYIITPKWDGTRMMMFYTKGSVYLLNKTTTLQAPVPYKEDLDGSIFDGEFFEKTGKYIAFDILFVAGEDVREKTRVERTLLLEQLHAEHNLEFELAEIGSGSDLHTCFQHYVNDYPEHTLDGVVFAPMSSPYYNKQTLKYKPIELLTIDFLVTVDSSSKYLKYNLFVQGNNGPESFAHVPYIQKVSTEGRRIIGGGNKIVEFKWQGDTFVPHRVREDKTTANYVTIAEDIWEDINNPITEQEMGAVLKQVSSSFKILAPFEGKWFSSLGPTYIVSPADSALTLQRSVMYCVDPRFQQKKEVDKNDTLAPTNIFNISKLKKNIQVLDYYSGKLIYDNIKYDQTIILAYTVGNHFYSVGRMERVNDVCSRVVRVFDEDKLSTHKAVKNHYDNIKYVDQQLSSSGNIRKYNNYVKALLISLKTHRGDSVLDIGAGKGGDIHKWCIQNIRSLTAVDISPVSLKEAQSRFQTTPLCKSVSGTFIEANAYSERLQLGKHNVVSSQFSFHYAFGSRHDAEVAVANVAESMLPRSVFILTLPNSREILRRMEKYGPTYGNKHYTISVKSHGTEFGSQYVFTLQDSVESCPEFLVDLSLLRRLFEKYSVVLEFALPFVEFVDKYSSSYPDLHARMQTPTLTDDEQDVVSLYNAICFRKQV